MILGALTIGAMLVLLVVNGLKIWNLYHKGEKYNWIWCVVLFFFALLAYAALFNNLMITFYASNQDTYLEPDYFEASNYFLFGQVMIFLSLALTLGEVMIYLGFIAFHSLGEATETRREHGGVMSFLKR